MVLFNFPYLIAEYFSSCAVRSVSPTKFVFQGYTCCPHSTAEHLCWGFVLAVCSELCRLPCPAVTGTLLHTQVIGKVLCTLCSLQVLSNAINPPSISQGVASTSNAHWKQASASGPLPSTSPSVTLGAPMMRLAHFTVTCLLGLESSFALGLKKLQLRLQQEQERHTKYKCRGRET